MCEDLSDRKLSKAVDDEKDEDKLEEIDNETEELHSELVNYKRSMEVVSLYPITVTDVLPWTISTPI